MAEIQPLRVELELEDDGRHLASVPDLPGVMAYGATPEEAITKVIGIANALLSEVMTPEHGPRQRPRVRISQSAP